MDIENCDDLSGLLDSMSKSSFGARQLGRAWSVLKQVSTDKECAVILTVSGAMTVAKLGRIFGALISRGIVNAVVTTGAVVTHAFVEEMGMKHYEAPEDLSDQELADLRLNRVYDSLEPEDNLEALERHVHLSLERQRVKRCFGSFEFVRHMSSELLDAKNPTGFLASALKHGVDIYVPAFTDSELGLYMFRFSQRKTKAKAIVYDPFRDLSQYAAWMRSQRKIAFLTLGGGVPRNWAQQMLPFLKSSNKNDKRAELARVIAAIRICPDQPSLGHLSGSTYSEGVTWGKFEKRDEKNFVEVISDATIVFPILAKALIQHFDSQLI
jgi:deoxyhypusine synthase